MRIVWDQADGNVGRQLAKFGPGQFSVFQHL